MKIEMKKSIFLLAGLVGLSLASCDDKSDLGTPQVNKAPTVVAANGVTITPNASYITGGIDLNQYENQNVPVFSIVLDNTFPETAQVVGTLEVASESDFSNAVELPVFINLDEAEKSDAGVSYKGYVEGNAWESAFQTFYKKNPAQETNYLRYKMFIREGDQVSQLNDEWALYSTTGGAVSVTPVDLDLPVEAEYYVYGKFVASNNLSQAVPMLHAGGHVYDNPMFSYFFEVAEGQENQFTLMVAPLSAKTSGNAAKCFGAADPTAVSGRLVEGGEPIKLAEAGPYKLEVNMLSLVYTISPAPKSLYVAAGGAQFNSKCLQVYTQDYVNYSGLCYIENHFKLTGQKGWNPLSYGAGEGEGTIAKGGDWIDVKSSEKGNYWMEVNLVDMKYAATYCKTWGVVGDVTGWADNADIAMHSIKVDGKDNKNVYQAEVTVPAAGGFKVRANGNWDVNFGLNAQGEAVKDGGNCQFGAAGTYVVTFDFHEYPYSITWELKAE